MPTTWKSIVLRSANLFSIISRVNRAGTSQTVTGKAKNIWCEVPTSYGSMEKEIMNALINWPITSLITFKVKLNLKIKSDRYRWPEIQEKCSYFIPMSAERNFIRKQKPFFKKWQECSATMLLLSKHKISNSFVKYWECNLITLQPLDWSICSNYKNLCFQDMNNQQKAAIAELNIVAHSSCKISVNLSFPTNGPSITKVKKIWLT